MANLRQANELLRAGRYEEALAIFSVLRDHQPGFVPYEQGYELALKRSGQAARSTAGNDAKTYFEALHPESSPVPAEGGKLFVVVTPVLNGEPFLAASLASVLDQAGDFFIDYFVKDAGSTDMTLDLLRDFAGQVGSGRYPLRCRGLRMRVESTPDTGMYDAVAYGFGQVHLRTHPDDVFTYLNADDVFAERAFSIVSNILDLIPAQWLCGQPHVINAAAETIVAPQFPLSYAQEDIREGLHDGKSLYGIQQEGSFWLRRLYDRTGGINRSLKLAGDFDLWQRFAAHCELLALDCPLAAFRSHGKQLSAQPEKYYEEVARVRASRCADGPGERVISTPESRQFRSSRQAPPGAARQRPGPVCFTCPDGTIRELAYLKRTWLAW